MARVNKRVSTKIVEAIAMTPRRSYVEELRDMIAYHQKEVKQIEILIVKYNESEDVRRFVAMQRGEIK